MSRKRIPRDRSRAARRVGFGAVGGVVALALIAGWVALAPAAVEAEVEFTDVERQTAEFHRYYEEITLTPEEQKVFEAALAELPAPCCSDRSALTCCCECNMARSWWGLSKHLITERGYDAAEVRTAVEGWFEFINPDGFSGDSCYAGKCFKAFRHDGCGGMMKDQVIY
ncbi:MAG: hypothetical protein R3244_03935 [Thermoanaerobaculia bacterium]|nr:hypothetical protein [Thermoanaerobaculia bacterium]